jgi:hypothetical protein
VRPSTEDGTFVAGGASVKVMPLVTSSNGEETGGNFTVPVPPITAPPALESIVCPFVTVVTGSVV